MMRLLRGCAASILIVLASSCGPPPPSQRAFQQWLRDDASRVVAFSRFEALLEREGVSNVVPNRDLWMVDRIDAQCAVEPFSMPPEEAWAQIVPALRYIRDHVEPAIGDVVVVSGYRDDAFNACVQGATRSAHRSYHALDLVPADRAVSRADLIGALCPIHRRFGPRQHIGFGIYDGQRFHIDARSYRGWGSDWKGASFPCREQTA
jgi:hypothetical protein